MILIIFDCWFVFDPMFCSISKDSLMLRDFGNSKLQARENKRWIDT